MTDSRPLRLLLAATALLLLPAAILYLSSAKLHYPTPQWDACVLDAVQAIRAGTFSDKPYIIHPPLYVYLLSWFQPLFQGGLLEGARLFNFGCYLVTGWLVFLLSTKLTGEKDRLAAGATGAALYFTSPLAVQGIYLLDLGDTATIPVCAAAYFCLLFSGGGFLRLILLSAAFALNLWAKLIHSLFLAAASLAFLFTSKKGERGYEYALAAVGGLLLFIATWALYSYNFLQPTDHWTPLKYFVDEMLFGYQRQEIAAGPREMLFSRALSVARVMLWLWPVLLLWVLRLIKRGLGTGPEKLMNYFIILFLIGAWVSKGTSNGFPKYHAAILPAVCALCGAYVAGFLENWRRSEGVFLAIMALAAGFCVYLAGDPLYTLNYSLKVALIAGSGLKAVVAKLGLQSVAVPALLLGLVLVYARAREKISPAVFSLLLSSFIWQAAMFGRQAGGDYFTTYGYGTTGKNETVRHVRENFSVGTVSGPNEFDWEFRAAGVPFLPLSDLCTMDKDCVLSVLRRKDIAFYVFGQASNTVEQVKFFLSLKKEDLGRSFAVNKKGDFWIYSFREAVK